MKLEALGQDTKYSSKKKKKVKTLSITSSVIINRCKIFEAEKVVIYPLIHETLNHINYE